MLVVALLRWWIMWFCIKYSLIEEKITLFFYGLMHLIEVLICYCQIKTIIGFVFGFVVVKVYIHVKLILGF
jgi:hypothetical protein